MKTKLTLLAVALCAGLLNVNAQEDNPDTKTRVISLAQGVNDAKQLSFALYPGYAPDLTINGVHKPWGFGAAALYPVYNAGAFSGFTGLRIDYLGDEFFAPSADIGIKADIQLHLFGRDFVVTPMAYGGMIFPLQGAGDKNMDLGAIVGGGVYSTLWQSADKRMAFTVFAAAEKWTLFDGVIYRPGAAFTFKF